MKILLLGANGQVGDALRTRLTALGEVVLATRRGTLEDGSTAIAADFDQPASLESVVERIAPEIVVNAAAYTAVDRAEDDVDAAYRANAEAPRHLATACARIDAKLVHYSTDYVFDGSASTPYREDDPTSPLGVYGASKLAGEDAIRASGARHLILRTAWVYGAHGANFMRTMLRLAKDRDELRVVADQTGTPTPAVLIADVTKELLQRHPATTGTFHLTASGGTHWQEFAKAITEGAHARGLIERMPRVLPITTAEYPTRAQRPPYSRLDTSKLQGVLGHALPSWEEGLDRVLDAMAIAHEA